MKKFLFLSYIIIAISCISNNIPSASSNSINDQDTNNEIKNEDLDGTLIIYNENNFLQGNSIFIRFQKPIGLFESVSYPQNIKLFAFGEDSDGKSHILLKDISHNTQQGLVEYKINSSLSKFNKIYITGTNGKIMLSKVSKKKNTFILTILRWDANNVSSLYKKALDETKTEQEAAQRKEKAEQEAKQKKEFEEGKDRYNSLLTEIEKNGSRLYKDYFSSNESLPIFINSYKTENDYLDAVNAYITFENTSNKTIKYVDFEVIPYNRVDDITYSTIDQSSQKIIQVVDYISPNARYKAKWKAVWFNSSISYMKINSIKITYSDNATEIIKNSQISGLYKTKGMEKEIYKDSEKQFFIKYNFGDNNIYLEMDPINESSLKPYEASFFKAIFFTEEPYTINGIKVESYMVSPSYKNGILLFPLDSETDNYEILAKAKLGQIKQTNSLLGSGSQNIFSYFLTEEQLKFLRDCISIKYYRNLKK